MLTYKMNVHQKRREIELNQANKLFHLYGEYYAIWKLYNHLFKSKSFTDERYIELMKRTLDVETEVEATLISITSSRKLSKDDVATLGCFRQSCQFFSESIRDDKLINYHSSNHPDYLRFKKLACKVGNMLLLKEGKSTKTEDAVESFIEITDNKWELECEK